MTGIYDVVEGVAVSPDEEFLTLAEAITFLGISRATMHRLLDQGKIPRDEGGQAVAISP